jgi:hypothetical protein
MANIVIYAASGKENAQKLLNKIYAIFKYQEGLNINPRWNEKVTSLIYFAQGDGDAKKLKENAKFFESGDEYGNGKVYFNPTVTGVYQDYHLINPAHPVAPPEEFVIRNATNGEITATFKPAGLVPSMKIPTRTEKAVVLKDMIVDSNRLSVSNKMLQEYYGDVQKIKQFYVTGCDESSQSQEKNITAKKLYIVTQSDGKLQITE